MSRIKPSMNIPSYLSGSIFMKAYRVLRLNVAVCLEDYDLTPTSWVLLGVIADAKNGVQLTDVADALNVKAPLITTMANELIERNLIDRIPHFSDKRAKLLVLTTAGKQFVKKVEVDMEKTLNTLLDGVGLTELEAYKNVLETIIKNNKL